MKKLTYYLLMLIFIGCSESDHSAKNSLQPNSNTEADTIILSENVSKEILNETANPSTSNTFKIGFPLDSLLSFDSEAELKKVFKSNVKRSVGYYPEGMGEYANTLLFPDSKNEVEFVWADDSINFSGLQYIKISAENTDWKTKEGITIGTDIKELENLNKKAFTFYGLEWDYSGMINWQDGHLSERKIFGSLGYADDVFPEGLEGLLGDHEIDSSSDLAKKAKLVLRELAMRRSE